MARGASGCIDYGLLAHAEYSLLRLIDTTIAHVEAIVKFINRFHFVIFIIHNQYCPVRD
jgi:hypothetical protein